MMVGIDASRANKDNKTGTEWYSYYIIQELKKMTPDNCQVVLYTNASLKGDLSVMPTPPQPSPYKGEGVSLVWREKDLSWPPKYLWTQIRLWWELIIKPPDVLFVPAHTIPFLPIRRKTKIFVTVHDVGFKRFPELYKKIQIWYHDLTMRRIKYRADIIITISDFSKREIIKLYRVNPEKIKVVYPGYDREKYNLSGEASDFRLQEIFQKYQIVKPYLLYVGRIERKKNVANLIRAFIEVKRQFPGLRLVLAGEGGNLYEEIKKIIFQEKVEQEIIMTGYVAEEDLPEILRNAEIFLFPTLYEGFGLPIIQAMASGVPVVASDLEPHREVSGGAAALARPMNHRAIAQKIIEILSNNKIREELSQKGLARAQDFSWEKTARGIWDLMN
ncbi:MAG: glycosyltransferase family 1 protein [Patescibacteria group bacterium]